ncbi:MAG: hypothetical protein JNL01_16480 [Bdellovibrionales bacterium]|nr:hypothetical protein [Bdellovibrionales bacterium]
MKILKVLGFLALFSTQAFAADDRGIVQFGLGAGINWTTGYYTSTAGTFPIITSTAQTSGIGPTLGLTTSWFQEYIMGLQIDAAFSNINLDSPGYRGNWWLASATGGFHFTLSNTRHYLGLGAAVVQKVKGGGQTVAFVFQGKDFWRTGKNGDVFLDAKVVAIGPTENPGLSLVMLIGYEF